MSIKIDNVGHIERCDEAESSARKRLEIAERLRYGHPDNVLFDKYDKTEERIAVINNISDRGIVGLVYMDLGVVRFNWRGFQNYVYNSFNSSDTTEDILEKAREIIIALLSLEDFYRTVTLSDYKDPNSEIRKIDWEKTHKWIEKCPIKYKDKSHILHIDL